MIVLTESRRRDPAETPRKRPLDDPANSAVPPAARLAEAVEHGDLTLEDAWARYRLTPEAIDSWCRARHGTDMMAKLSHS
jgi:hypothetical protein